MPSYPKMQNEKFRKRISKRTEYTLSCTITVELNLSSRCKHLYNVVRTCIQKGQSF